MLGLKKQQDGLKMKPKSSLVSMESAYSSQLKPRINASYLTTTGVSSFFPANLPRLGTDNDYKQARVGQPSPLKKGQPSVTSSQVANGLVSLPLRGEALAAL